MTSQIQAHGTRSDHVGRRPATTPNELERVAFRLFSERGFEETTIEEIAAGCGISRRTFFHYFASKNDVVWGDFDGELAKLRTWLEACPAELPMTTALHGAVLAFNAIRPDEVDNHRLRMSFILHVPQLQAHSTLRYTSWREVISQFAANRLGQSADALLPRVIGHVLLGAAVAAYEVWLADASSDLVALLDEAMRDLTEVYGRFEGSVGRPRASRVKAGPVANSRSTSG